MSAQPEKNLLSEPVEMEREESLDFAAKLNRLEEIVKRLESGDLSLEESLLKFEEGIKLARELETVLARADSRVQEILKPSGELEK
ncbi:MAG: exodeoxyribonuclease VII small subunit [Bacillota bacterium]|jgi:exodeoxyribonuclease VII small subunit